MSLENFPGASAGRHCHGSPPLPSQRGLGLASALFVITLMAVLAVAINRQVSQNADAFAEEVNLVRALNAAESGAGFAMNTLFPPAEYPDYDVIAECPDNVGAERLYEFEVDGLNACTAAVSCAIDAEVDEVEYYTITSTGTCDGVARTVQVRARF